MSLRVRLDSAGIGEVLNSREVRGEIESLASSVALDAANETVGSEPMPVTMTERVASGARLSPRPAFDVTLAHPAGLRVEAKRSTLLRAARSIGLEVRGRGSLS